MGGLSKKVIKGPPGSFMADSTICSKAVHENGGEKDENSCLTSAGYSWCELKSKCTRKSECVLLDEGKGHLIGGEWDEHGCLTAAGYFWCEVKSKCLRTSECVLLD